MPWITTPIQSGQVVQDANGTYWTPGTNNEPGLLFPTLIGYLVAFNNQYVIQSTYPWVSDLLGRNVLVRGYVNGTWQIIYSGPESALAEPTTYDFQTLPITALQVVYLVADCQYTAGATVIPPFGECGTITATITAERDCGTDEFFVIVDIEEISGYPLGNLVVTLNGAPQAPVAASLGVTLLGPYETGDIVGVRITNAQDSECDFDAGTYQDPNIPIADRTVVEAVDASFEGSQVPGSAYLIVSDTTDAGNTWAQHVGEFFNGAIFIPLVEGEVVQTLSETDFTRFWQRVGSYTVQMYPSVTLNNTQSYPFPWTVVSNNPTSATGRFRPAVVEVQFDGVWYPLWSGLEDSLKTPQIVDFTQFGLVSPQGVRVSYFGTQCPITVEGDVVSENVTLEFECGRRTEILGSGDLYDIYYDWNDGLYLITSDDDDLIGTDPAFADLAIGDVIGIDATYSFTPSPGEVLYLSNGGGAYWTVGDEPGEITLSPYQGVGNIFYFTQLPSSLQTWLFTAPSGQSVEIQFISGTMGAGNVLRGYDGPNDLSPSMPFPFGNYPSLAGNTGTTSGENLFMEAESNSSPTDDQDPWVFIVNCLTGSVRPSATVTPTDNCTDYNFSIDIEVIDPGDSDGGLVDIQYVVGGEVTTISDVAAFTPLTIGPFAYDAQVQVYIRHRFDPSADLFAGTFQSSGGCVAPPNPCLPESTFKVDLQGDLADLPVPPPNPMISEFFFVVSDNTNIGTFVPSSILAWSMMAQEWELLFVAPEGSFIYGSQQVVVGSLGEAVIYGNGPAGAYNAFAPILVGINPDATGITDNIRIKIDVVEQGFITTDRPVKLQVFSEGQWVDVWTGTEQQLGQWTPIGIPFPFTLARSVYNYDTCAVEAAYLIDLQQGIQTP